MIPIPTKEPIMASNLITNPYTIMLSPTGGGGRAKPIANGQFYYGAIDQDPLLNPIQVYYKDETGTEVQIDQPLRTNNSGAFVANDGQTLINPYTKEVGHSTLALDQNGQTIYKDLHVGDPGNVIFEIRSRTNLEFDTLDEAVNSPILSDGTTVTLKERVSGNGGGGAWDVVLASSVTPNGNWIVQSVEDPSLALVKRKSEKVEYLETDSSMKSKLDLQVGDSCLIGSDESSVDALGKAYLVNDENKGVPLDNGLNANEHNFFDVMHGMNLSDQEFARFSALNPSRRAASVLFSSGVITLNTHLGGDDWRQIQLKNNGEVSPGVDTPYKVVSQKIYKSTGWQTVKDATEGGTWSAFSSGSNVYVGHEVRQSNSPGNTLTWKFTAKGDFELGFTGDTDGGIVEVSIDGGAPVDVDTYSPTANDFRRFELFAINQEEKEHTVVVTSTNRKNPASSGTQANITSIRISGGDIAPYSTLYQPKPWKAGEVVRDWEEVQGPLGGFYNCSTGGTTGGNPPTHLSGSVSDGGVTWTYQGTESSFSSEDQLIQAEGSELEYKYDAQPVGQSGYEDVGGNLHGNEFLKSAPKFLINGVETDISDELTYIGSTITVLQEITDFYGPYATRIDIADVNQFHTLSNGIMDVKVDFEVLTDFDKKVSYACMWPFLTYNAVNYVKNFETFSTPRANLNLVDFEGIAQGSPNEGNKKDFWMQAQGRAYTLKGSGGAPTSDNGKTGLRIALKPSSQSVNNYNLSKLNAGMAPNINGGRYTGYSSWVSKMYIQDVGDTPQRLVAGDKFTIGGQYIIDLTPNSSDVGSL